MTSDAIAVLQLALSTVTAQRDDVQEQLQEWDQWSAAITADMDRRMTRAIEAERDRDEVTAQRDAAREAMLDALDCLPRALSGGQPFSLDQRAEVMLAIESLKRGLPAEPAQQGARDVPI